MKFIDDLIPLKVYSSASKLYLPIREEDKKKGSAIMMLANDHDDIVSMMKNPAFVNNHHFNCYYADTSVDAIINHENCIVTERDNNTNPYKNSFPDVKKVVKTLSKKELYYICGGTFKDSPYVIYRDIAYDNKHNPIGFIDVYTLPEHHTRKEFDSHADIVFAVTKDARGKGVASSLVSKMLTKFKSAKYSKYRLVWTVDNDNTTSAALAKRFGFIEYKKNKEKTIFVLKSKFALEEERRFPIDTEQHVLESVHFFNEVKKYTSDVDEVAEKIINKIKELKIEDKVIVSEDNDFHKYLSELISEEVIFRDSESKAYISFKGGNITDINEISKTINFVTIKELNRKLGNTAKLEGIIEVHIHNTLSNSNEMYKKYKNPLAIHVCRPFGYNERKYGPYELYLKHELSAMLIRYINPNINEYLCSYIAMWMSDQVKVFKNRSDVYVEGAIAVEKFVEKEGVHKLVQCIKNNSIEPIAKNAARNFAELIIDLFSLKESSILESSKVSLSKYTKKVYDESFSSFVDKYKNKYKFLSHIRSNSNTMTIVYVDKDNLVGILNIEQKDNGEKWVQALEITKDYQGEGLSKQIMKVAINNGAKFLSVNKNNNIAIKVYKDVGYKVYKETDNQYFMKHD